MRAQRITLVLCILAASPACAQSLTWHARLTPSYVNEATSRGGWSVGVLNWAGLEYRRSSERNIVTARVMGSAEPYTLTNCGYSHVLAPDANCASRPRDISAAHPLVMEASLTLQHRLSAATLNATAALAGEPALGPPAYMHRISAQFDPIAPYTDHLTNSQHAAYSVFTVGLTGTRWSLATSTFDSQERHSSAKSLRPGTPDAVSARLGYRGAAVQADVSIGNLPAAGHQHGGTSIGGGRANVAFLTVQGGREMGLSYTGVLGFHDVGPGIRLLNLEGTMAGRRVALFARAEIADALTEQITIIVQPDSSHLHNVKELRSTGAQIGGGAVLRRILSNFAEADVGARAWLSVIPNRQRELYDMRRTAPGFAVFTTVRAASASHHHHE